MGTPHFHLWTIDFCKNMESFFLKRSVFRDLNSLEFFMGALAKLAPILWLLFLLLLHFPSSALFVLSPPINLVMSPHLKLYETKIHQFWWNWSKFDKICLNSIKLVQNGSSLSILVKTFLNWSNRIKICLNCSKLL